MNVLMYCPTCREQARVGLLNASSREKLKAEIESGAPIQVMHTDTEGDHIWTLSAKEAAELGNSNIFPGVTKRKARQICRASR